MTRTDILVIRTGPRPRIPRAKRLSRAAGNSILQRLGRVCWVGSWARRHTTAKWDRTSLKSKVRVAPYTAILLHWRTRPITDEESKLCLTNVNGHSGDELHCRTWPDFTDHRPKSNEFVFFRPYSSVLLVLWTFYRVRILSSAENGWFGEINVISFWKETFIGHKGQTAAQQRHCQKAVDWSSYRYGTWK